MGLCHLAARSRRCPLPGGRGRLRRWARGQSWRSPERPRSAAGQAVQGPFLPCRHFTVFEVDLFLSDAKLRPRDAGPGVGLRPLRPPCGRGQLPPSPGVPGPARRGRSTSESPMGAKRTEEGKVNSCSRSAPSRKLPARGESSSTAAAGSPAPPPSQPSPGPGAGGRGLFRIQTWLVKAG